MSSERFTSDNTPGRTSDDLKALNAAFQATCEDADLPTKSAEPQLALMLDHMTETILDWYDQGRRGNALIIPQRAPTGFKRIVLPGGSHNQG